MNVAGAGLNVSGTTTFSGGASTLTNGVMKLSGNFVQNTAATSFTASGLHKTRFLGTTPTISFANPTTSSFGRLELQSSGIVNFATDVLTTGDVWLQTGGPPAVTNVGSIATIGGALYDSTGGRWQVISTVMSGTTGGTLPKFITTNLTFSNAVTLGDSLHVTGNVTSTGAAASLDLNGKKMIVSGNFSTAASGVFKMTNPSNSDSLIV